MAKEPVVKNGKTTEAEAMRVILGTLGDTTWRMFTPTFLCTLIGVWADGEFGTKPWLMFIGIVIGFVSAGLLVWQQYQQATMRKE